MRRSWTRHDVEQGTTEIKHCGEQGTAAGKARRTTRRGWRARRSVGQGTVGRQDAAAEGEARRRGSDRRNLEGDGAVSRWRR